MAFLWGHTLLPFLAILLSQDFARAVARRVKKKLRRYRNTEKKNNHNFQVPG